MLFSALALVLGLLPSAFAQFSPACAAQCSPVEAYLNNCGTLPTPAEGLACIRAICTATTLDECVACSAPATGFPPEQYYGMFGCPVPTPTPSTTSTQPSATCGRPGKGHGKGHGKGKGKGHGKHGDGDDSEDED
ncbi:hypothetical protein CC85DRAFT_319045 [Cutaneotrichosporon oleaginosum]|uniref:Extracellular membrane protein CFEM domain-containing protein n=1 Tax=Cutaneotrichosporon oleaginosum TaxID=879819 RepID=A0A0J0XMI0_9TREE|nr:uncharacterized protein CC85DRAFT_319045 [Cutaneotrichosporon oleaginosum]KLT42292.1 hypothetical protein CC85DRAFT_319045 [Cutaneotrichosporon oleaginosum]TXT11464.1 hypothetical protein COLE_01874 [Cutaneotrichosporon oleaginosum]